METKQLVERILQMPTQTWRALALRMAWHYRTEGTSPMPPKVLALTDGEVPSLEVWREVRTAVARARRRAKLEAARQEAQRKQLARRSYMRTYMRDYRARKSTPA